jgi:hypothetical protein
MKTSSSKRTSQSVNAPGTGKFIYFLPTLISDAVQQMNRVEGLNCGLTVAIPRQVVKMIELRKTFSDIYLFSRPRPVATMSAITRTVATSVWNRRIASYIVALCLFSLTFFSAPGYAASPSNLPVRGLYWDYTYKETKGNTQDLNAAVDDIKSMGVDELHLWLNDNNPTFRCDYVLQYSDIHWDATGLRTFINLLIKAGIRPVLTFSPIIQSKQFLQSLSAPDGPFALAAEFNGLDIELDLEWYWTERARVSNKEKQCSTYRTEQASADLLKAMHTITPHSHLRVSTTKSYLPENAHFIAAADIVSPQLYDGHLPLEIGTARQELTDFVHCNPDKVFTPAFSTECTPDDESHGRCGRKQFSEQLKWMYLQYTSDPKRYPGYIIWGREEVNLKCTTVNPVCSSFGADYLKCTAHRIPDATCD